MLKTVTNWKIDCNTLYNKERGREIAKNLWFNELKKNKRIVLTDDEKDLADMKYNIEDKFLLEQDKVELHKKIYNLDSQIKEIFYSCIIEKEPPT